MRKIALMACVAAAMGAVADEFFVATNGVDNTSDGWGKTEATAFLSIQAAVDAASAGDTVTLLPGDHVEGSVKVSSLLCRVNVTKTLTIRSKGRAFRDATRIVGAWDPSATSPVGMGPNAVRCVQIAAEASGTRLEGITLYRGATDYNGNTAAVNPEGREAGLRNKIAAMNKAAGADLFWGGLTVSENGLWYWHDGEGYSYAPGKLDGWKQLVF